MVKIILLGLLVLTVLILMGCNTFRTEDTAVNQTVLNESIGVTNESVLNNTIINSAGACTPQWRCISSQLKAYQLANCSFTSKLKCPLGCFNDSCRVAETCTPGFGCVNDHIKGYQMESCQWASQTNCDWKCENGECVPKPENYTEPESAATSTEPAASASPPRYSLAAGSIDNITVGGIGHSISIYAIEPARVRIVVDDLRSDWATEGSTITFSNGVTLVIKEILFQSFSEGQRKVVYTVG